MAWLGLSQEEVARRMGDGVRAGQVSTWASGRHTPRAETLARLARALECGVEDLLAGPTDQPIAPQIRPAPAPAADLDAAGRLARIARLLERLHRDGEIPVASRLARESGVHQRTVYRDLDGLRLILSARGEELTYRPVGMVYVLRPARRKA